MTRILSGDLLIADVIVPLEGNDALFALLDKFHMEPGDKRSLHDRDLREFTDALKDVPVTVMPGGSSANMLTTLSKLLGTDVEIRFLGLTGAGNYGNIIRDAITEANITLLPERLPPGYVPQTSVSFVFVYPDGQCTTATHPGNAREILKPAMIAEHFARNSDAVLVQGSLWNKFHPDFAERMYKLCLKHGRQLWLTLPTQAKLNVDEAEKFQKMIPNANIILGNEFELTRLFGESLESSLNHLQRILWDRIRNNHADTAGRKAMAFITFGKDGAAVVTPQSIDFVPPMEIDPAEIVNTIGAGDTAYAGFVAGCLKGLPTNAAAQIAMTLAGEKLRINGPRLLDPKGVLAQVNPDLAQMLKPARRRPALEATTAHP